MSKIILAEQASAPDTPGSGKVAIYVDGNGDLSWKDDAGNINRIASTGGYTLTLTASGILAAITSAAYTPTITGSSSNPTVEYAAQVGRYSRIGDVVFFDAYVVITTISGGSGDVRVSLPVANSTGRNTPANAYTSGVDLGGTPVNVLAIIPSGAQYALIDSIQDNAGVSRLQISGLAAGDGIYLTGFYFV